MRAQPRLGPGVALRRSGTHITNVTHGAPAFVCVAPHARAGERVSL